jgi:hypothetical protein
MRCLHCGAENEDTRASCAKCGSPLPSPPVPPEAAHRKEDIEHRNSRALAGYYLGILSLIPLLGAVLGPVAVVVGVMGARAAPTAPGQVGQAHARIGIILGILTTLANWGVLLWLRR